MDSSAQSPDLELDETGLDSMEDDAETQRLVDESHRKTLPVNIIWMLATTFGILAILWAMVAAIRNKRSINAKELPYIGFLCANLLILLIIEIPDIVIFTTGQQVHNEWSKFIYDTVNNLPLFNLAWIGLQNLIIMAHPDWMSIGKSAVMGALFWLFGIALALPLSFSFSIIDEDHEYMAKFIPLFLVSFLLQKVLPLAFSVITILLSNLTAASQVQEYCGNKERKCCWMLFEKSTRGYVLDLIAVTTYTVVWISEDIHILIYLFNGNTLAGLELYHIAIYNLIETTGIFVAVCLVMSGNDNLCHIRVRSDSTQEIVESCNKSVNASVTNLLSSSQDDPEGGSH